MSLLLLFGGAPEEPGVVKRKRKWSIQGRHGVFPSSDLIPLALDASIELGSASATASAGTIAAVGAGSITLTGAASTASAGTIGAAGTATVTLGSAAATSAAGMITATGAAATTLTGAEVTASAGTISAEASGTVRRTRRYQVRGRREFVTSALVSTSTHGTIELGSALVTASAGDITAEAGDKTTVRVSDRFYASRRGVTRWRRVVPEAQVFLESAAATASAGTLALTGGASVTLTGASVTASASDLVPSGTTPTAQPANYVSSRGAIVAWRQGAALTGSVTLTGAQAVISAGTIVVTASVTAALTGASATASAGTIAATGNASVTLGSAGMTAIAGILEAPYYPYIYSGRLKYDIVTGRMVKILSDHVVMSL